MLNTMSARLLAATSVITNVLLAAFLIMPSHKPVPKLLTFQVPGGALNVDVEAGSASLTRIVAPDLVWRSAVAPKVWSCLTDVGYTPIVTRPGESDLIIAQPDHGATCRSWQYG